MKRYRNKMYLHLRKGRSHKILSRLYGSRAFTSRGTIKIAYLNKAIRHAKHTHNASEEKALVLAKTMKTRWRKRR